MKINRLGYNFSPLEKSQMKTIDTLQEKIRLIEFDKSQINIEVRTLKEMLKRRKGNLILVIQELELIKKECKYEKLSEVIHTLKLINRDIDDD